MVEFIGRQKDGFVPSYDLGRQFRNNQKSGFELDRVMNQLKREGRVYEGTRAKSRGPVAVGWHLVKEG